MPLAEPVSWSRLLVADVGGTNARFAIADLETLILSEIEEFQCARYSSLAEAMRAYLDRLDDPPAEAAIAVAGTLMFPLPFGQLWLAYAPGGVEAMAAMALALHLDPAFVGAHHVLRILGLNLISPLWLRNDSRSKSSP